MEKPITRREFLKKTINASKKATMIAAIPTIDKAVQTLETLPQQPDKNTHSRTLGRETGPPKTPPNSPEKQEKPEKNLRPIINAHVTVMINQPDIEKKTSGIGAIFDQNGKLYWVTARHNLPEDDPDARISITSNKHRGTLNIGTTKDWQFTQKHPLDDPRDKGIAYLELAPHDEQQVRKHIQEGEILPLSFTGTFMRKGERVGYIKRFVPYEDTVQFARLETTQNWQTDKRAINPELKGVHSFTIVDENKEHMFAKGNSGTPILRVDSKGNPTNEALGLLINTPEAIQKDGIHGKTQYGDKGSIIPVHALTNQKGEVQKNRPNISHEPTQVRKTS